MKLRIVNTERIIPQCHCHGLKAEYAKSLHACIQPESFFIKISPRNLKNRAHAHTGSTAVKRIAAAAGQKDCIHVECCRGAKNRTDISWIYDIFQNCYASGILADFLDSLKGAAFHDAEQSSSQSITGQFYKDFIFCCIYRGLRKTCQKFFRLALNILMLDQK